jgi:hypothetical protein
MRPLDGIRVLDFSTLLPGPMASLLLAEAGAEVLKIERPGRGEEMRSYEPRWGQESVNFALLNRGKKSIAADLKDPATRDRVLALATTVGGRSAIDLAQCIYTWQVVCPCNPNARSRGIHLLFGSLNGRKLLSTVGCLLNRQGRCCDRFLLCECR